MTGTPKEKTSRVVRTSDAAAQPREHDTPRVISMEEAVGYSRIPRDGETPLSGTIAIKHDRIFLLTDQFGNVAPPGNCSLGLFEDDTRIASHYELRVAGTPQAKLSAEVVHPYHAQIDLAVTDHAFGGDTWDPKHAIYLSRELMIEDRLIERLTFTNFLTRAIDYWAELWFACDFADIFEVRGWKRDERGEFFAPTVEPSAIRLAYRGRDGLVMRSAIEFRQTPDFIDERRARWSFRLLPGAPISLEWAVSGQVAARRSPEPSREIAPAARRKELAEVYTRWRSECSGWRSNDAAFDATLARATDDLRSLYISDDGEEVISAGLPWYATVFGRDSIITSLEALPLNPRIAIDTLRYLARHQGTKENAYTEEQPGKILHELRRGEMARSGEIPHVPYYGTIDATPLWIVLLHETWRWTGDDTLVSSLLPNLRRALEWIDRYGDLDGDGFVEYARTSDRGLVNQGWKDSGDGVPYPDGRHPDPPIALVEVQGYVYDAKLRSATLFAALGEPEMAQRLYVEAESLRDRVLDRFWLEELDTFALALDGEKRPLPTVTTNAGHLLWSRLPTADHARRMANTLLAPDMFCGWGIRTLSSRHPVFNPMSYHDGSVWPHDNAIVVMGLSHYGLAAHALPAVAALQDAAATAAYNRLAELYCGMNRDGGTRPVQYPVSCSPQAWASAAPFMLLQAVLGIFPDATQRVLHVRNPLLPAQLDKLVVTDLHVGSARISLGFERHGSRTLVNVFSIESSGEPIRVQIDIG